VRAGGVTTEIQDRRQQALVLGGVLPILDWGLTYYSWQIALDRRRQEQFLVARAEQLLRRDVRVAYARHAGAVRQERLASIAYQAGGQVLRVAKSLEREHLTVRADTALIEAALAEAALALSLARQSVEQTHLTLAQLMSLPPGVSFRTEVDLPALPAPPSEEAASLFEQRALAVRPELAVQDLERRASASAVRRDAAAFFPRLDLAGSFNWSAQSGLVHPAFFLGGFQVSHALLSGGANLFQYQLSRKTEDLEKERTLLISLGVLYEVQLRALQVRQAHETVIAAEVLERSRKAALERIISLYKEGLEDEAGAARALAALTVEATALDRAQTEYVAAWHELEAAVLPETSMAARAATQPASAPASRAAEAAGPDTVPASGSTDSEGTQP
jgi:outer membrane protein TolC